MTAHHSNESGRSAGFPFPTTLPFFFIILPTFLPALPTSWARGNWGFAVYRECQAQKTNERTAVWVGHGIRRLLYLLSPLSQPTFISLSLCLWLVYLFQSLIHGCTSLGYFFLYFSALLFFSPLLLNEFQTDEKTTVSFRPFVFLSYSIYLPFLSVQNIYYG